MRSQALAATAVLGFLTACAAEPETRVNAADGDVFEASSGALAVATDWSWELAGASDAQESGSCGYTHDAAPTQLRWRARFSADPTARDPLTGEAYPHGHWLIAGDGALGRTPAYASPSSKYGCSLADAAAPVAPSAHFEMALAASADGVRVQGYVTRLYIFGIAAPVDMATGRQVSVGFSIPAPLLVQGALRAEADHAELELESSASSDPPEFVFGLGVSARGMSATGHVRFDAVRLERAGL